ncbi:MAG TPA: hypothetical protein VFP05_11515, partial [Thermomicrobiales bacterium]|nr:hypothetical protein [Thermomicrobiales bacterium]
WGWASLDGWQTFFDDSAKASGADAVDASNVIFNDYVDGANAFDAEQVAADASGFELSAEFAAVTVASPEATPAG